MHNDDTMHKPWTKSIHAQNCIQRENKGYKLKGGDKISYAYLIHKEHENNMFEVRVIHVNCNTRKSCKRWNESNCNMGNSNRKENESSK